MKPKNLTTTYLTALNLHPDERLTEVLRRKERGDSAAREKSLKCVMAQVKKLKDPAALLSLSQVAEYLRRGGR